MYLMNMYQSKGIPYLVKESEYPAAYASNPWEIIDSINLIFKADKLPEEHVWLICLNTQNKITSIHEVSKGTINSSPVDNKAILSRALLSGAVKIVLAHNHPSGSCSPSGSDDVVMEKLKTACSYVDIELVDFIIIGENSYYSYCEERRM